MTQAWSRPRPIMRCIEFPAQTIRSSPSTLRRRMWQAGLARMLVEENGESVQASANEERAALLGAAPLLLDWKTWALVPLLMAVSMPFIQAIGHGQNTCLSLLIVAATVKLWRKDCAVAAG